MTEEPAHRLKRMKIRAWRRGTKEMDLVLGPWADAHLATLEEGDLVIFDAILAENDHDLYAWLTGRSAPPPSLSPLLERIIADTARNSLAD